MAKRKKKTEAKRAAPEPFNNPFGPSFRQVRKALRRALDATVRTPRTERTVRSKQDETAQVDDDTRFRNAVSGATPLENRLGRIHRRPLAESGVVKDRRRDEDALTSDEHFDLRFSDRFISASAAGVSRETLAKLERGEFAVRSHVDLHGMALDDARCVVDQFLAERQRQGERCVLVITGKGRNSRQQIGVLREKIPEWLARGPSARRVLAFVTARPCDGGEGALYVLLRNRASGKARIDIIAGGGT